MKCIEFNDDSGVKKVSDEEAEKLVDSGKATYVSKSFFKSYNNLLKKVDEEKQEAVRNEIKKQNELKQQNKDINKKKKLNKK